jgi:hypothetical protein
MNKSEIAQGFSLENLREFAISQIAFCQNTLERYEREFQYALNHVVDIAEQQRIAAMFGCFISSMKREIEFHTVDLANIEFNMSIRAIKPALQCEYSDD